MEDNARRSEWLVLLGGGLVLWGIWLILERVLGPIFWPLGWTMHVLNRIGWPLVLVAVGLLLVTRGRRTTMETTNTGYRRLYRSRTDRKIAGVIGGAAVYLGVDATLLRVLYAVLTLMTAFWAGIAIYVIAMILVPEEPVSWTATASAPPVPPAPPVPDPSGYQAPPVPPTSAS